MSDVLKDVQDAHANYSKMLTEKRTYLAQVKDQIKQLRVEFKTTLAHIAELTGAVNVGGQVIQKLQATTPAVVEGEVVKE